MDRMRVAVLVAVGALVVGCSGSAAEGPSTAAQADSVQADGVQAEAVEAALNDSLDGNATVDLAEAEIPADFPSEIPLPSGNPTVAIAMAGGWQVNYVLGSPAEVATVVESFKSDPSWALLLEQDLAGNGAVLSWMFGGQVWDVMISQSDQGDGTYAVAYTVGPTQNAAGNATADG